MSAVSTYAPPPAGLTKSPVRPGRASAGFTLIEVLLSLTIFALMGTVLYGAFSLGHSAMAKSELSFTQAQQTRTRSDLLASYLRSAYPYRESPQDPGPYFYGESQALEFVSVYSHGLGGRGMAKITITGDEDGRGRALVKLTESVPVNLGEGAGAHAHSLTLQEDVRDFAIAYLDPRSELEQWTDRWDAKEHGMLPRAVRLSYRLGHGEEVRWVFPLMMAVLMP